MARSNNNNKLKAYVRFDGSGRVVSSSLIVQAFKPAVGNWKEIDAKECCNYTTTTTTTSVTYFPYLVSLSVSDVNACEFFDRTVYIDVFATESNINNITVLYESPSPGVYVPFTGGNDAYHVVAVPGVGIDPPTNYTNMFINSIGVVSNKSTC